MARCTTTNIQGKQCRLIEHAADIGLCHDYEPLPSRDDTIEAQNTTIATLTAERDQAIRDLTVLRTHLTDKGRITLALLERQAGERAAIAGATAARHGARDGAA